MPGKSVKVTVGGENGKNCLIWNPHGFWEPMERRFIDRWLAGEQADEIAKDYPLAESEATNYPPKYTQNRVVYHPERGGGWSVDNLWFDANDTDGVAPLDLIGDEEAYWLHQFRDAGLEPLYGQKEDLIADIEECAAALRRPAFNRLTGDLLPPLVEGD